MRVIHSFYDACSGETTEDMTETELGEAPCDKFVVDSPNGK